MRNLITLRVLADEAGMDLEEALVTIWDAGIDLADDVDALIPVRMLSAIKHALGLDSPKERQLLTFWETRWGLNRAEVREKLSVEYGILVSAQARTLPKGASRKLRKVQVSTLGGSHSREIEKPPESHSHEFSWNPPGHQRDVISLTVDEIQFIHEELIRDFAESGDRIEPSGQRDEHLLPSAVCRPETSLGGERKYPTVESHAAALVHSLVHNHPFYNGNKRTALVSMLVLLDRNNLMITCDDKELFRQILRIAQHRVVTYSSRDVADGEVLEIARWICCHTRILERGERILKWRELRRVLLQLGCQVGPPLPGNKVKVDREVLDRKLGIRYKRKITRTVGYRNDGQDVTARELSRIRKILELDDDHGYDSTHFYSGDPREPSEFITQYRTLLRRLGKI